MPRSIPIAGPSALPSRSAAAACFYSLLLLSVDGRTTTSPTSSAPIELAAAQQQHSSSRSSRPPSLLQSTCNSTTYYDLCVAALAADPKSSTADVRGLCAIAVSAAAANAAATASALLANATAAAVASASDQGQQANLLLRTCAAKYADAREALHAALDSVAEEAYDYALVHVSAAAEYPAVCRALFRRQRQLAYPAELARREEGLERLCTIALDIISLLG